MKTILGNEIPQSTRGLLYLCDYNNEEKTLEPVQDIMFESAHGALEAYANIPNPASQLASGKTQEEFEDQVEQLHKRMVDREWQRKLSEYL